MPFIHIAIMKVKSACICYVQVPYFRIIYKQMLNEIHILPKYAVRLPAATAPITTTSHR